MYNKPERRCINMQRNIKTLLEKHPVSETILNIPVDYVMRTLKCFHNVCGTDCNTSATHFSANVLV